MKEVELKVEGMHCEGCENRIKNVLKTIEKVKEVEADHKEGKVKIEAENDVDLNQIKEKIEDLDFKVVD